MADIINLRDRKKALDRARECCEATENAARFGRSKALKKLEKARADKDRATVDAHKRDPKA
jgi:hypothetical protein